MTKMCSLDLTKNIYTLLPLFQHLETERSKELLERRRLKKAKKTLKSTKIASSKESKLLPILIFEMEKYEKEVMKLSTSSKVFVENQMSHIYCIDKLDPTPLSLYCSRLSYPGG